MEIAFTAPIVLAQHRSGTNYTARVIHGHAGDRTSTRR